MGAHLDNGRITAEIVRIAAMPGGARQRAEALIDSLRPLLRHDAAWLSLLDPEGRRQQPITAPGHTGRLQRHLAGREFMAVLERVGLHRARRPMRVFESPVPAEELPSWVDYFRPDGFAEGVALPLVTTDGRYLGLLGAHAGSPDPLCDDLCDLLATLAPLIAHAVDPLRTLTALAGMVHGATAGVVLTRAGRTELLPGMPGPDAFGVEPPALHLVGALLAPGRSIARFMVPSTDPERGLVQVTALACPPEPPGHHRALVLLGPPPETYGLTRREMQVLGLLVEGRSNAAIAGALRITPRTAIGHLEHIMAKMGAESRTAAAVRADRQGLYVPAELLRRGS
ncbi:LuxR C-terminal-related transcriptional regulator [Actinoplanes hulinensis]|uniref:LuxR C-terminal-related transcriptional regulator n=1 Tax=Actinoplanes hulinensis TaxID=1144547 RepID=A0ABS7B1U8_9ACTN|nr:LuxR C-terminal-related transcriptional regulator [Actinoplanes hulinensis]MBW6434258.1 LuxR C-terminal-related transcriptional regulator [Actinoplanes hulinensis]